MVNDLDLIGVTEAARLLRKNHATVRRWAETGHLPVALRAPGPRGAYMFLRSDVEARMGPCTCTCHVLERRTELAEQSA